MQHVPALVSLIEAGIGVGAVPAYAVPGGHQASLVSVSLVEPEIFRTIGITRRRGRPLTPAAQAFHDILVASHGQPTHQGARKKREGATGAGLQK